MEVDNAPSQARARPATRTDLGRKYGDQSVRGYDATFSAPKSVSVIFALGDVRNQDTR